MRASLALPFLALAGATAPSSCRAQPAHRSEPGSVSQMIGDTRLQIAYHRPTARGRELFGSLVPWDRVWSPSSDTAALLTVSAPIKVNGETLAAGTYSLFAIPGHYQWTLIFSTAHPTFHLAYRERNDALRVRAASRAGEHMETLAFYFPRVDSDSAELVLHWGRTVVPLSIRVRP